MPYREMSINAKTGPSHACRAHAQKKPLRTRRKNVMYFLDCGTNVHLSLGQSVVINVYVNIEQLIRTSMFNVI